MGAVGWAWSEEKGVRSDPQWTFQLGMWERKGPNSNSRFEIQKAGTITYVQRQTPTHQSPQNHSDLRGAPCYIGHSVDTCQLYRARMQIVMTSLHSKKLPVIHIIKLCTSSKTRIQCFLHRLLGVEPCGQATCSDPGPRTHLAGCSPQGLQGLR